MEKLVITPEAYPNSKPFTALFNPNELRFTRNLTWTPFDYIERPGGLHFTAAPPRTLALELFFDTYATTTAAPEEGDPVFGIKASAFDLPEGDPFVTESPQPASVFDAMQPLLELAKIQQALHRPPYCNLSWGTIRFRGVLQQASETVTMFLANGTPVRATVACTFQEVADPIELQSPDVVKRHLIRPGDTLMNLAVVYYNDRAQWRRIADANRLENPRILRPGTTLTIPRI